MTVRIILPKDTTVKRMAEKVSKLTTGEFTIPSKNLTLLVNFKHNHLTVDHKGNAVIESCFIPRRG